MKGSGLRAPGSTTKLFWLQGPNDPPPPIPTPPSLWDPDLRKVGLALSFAIS